MPKIISIEDIKEGMELHSEVANKFGQILIGAGVQLADKHKKILKTWNITNIEIKSDDPEEVIELTEEVFDAAKEYISTKIKWKPNNKYEEELICIAIKTAATWLKKGINNGKA